MKKIQQVFVVEGKNDTARLKSIYDCDTIETGGSALSKKTISLLQELVNKRGLIVFTDPDNSGERLRKIINEKVKGCYHAFLRREDCSTLKKVGIEHATKEVIQKALEDMLYYDEVENTLSLEEYYRLGLNGKESSFQRRELLAKAFHLGHVNAKTCFKRLNMLQKTKEDCLKILGDKDETGDCDE